MSDADLTGRIAGKKDQQAFSELYDRYADRMVNYFYRMLWKDGEKAQDFTQDLFAKLVHKPHLYDGKRAFKTWFFSIANNMCKNEYRKHEVRRNTGYEMPADAEDEHTTDVGGELDKKAFNDRLNEVLEELDEVKRSTFEMRYREHMKHFLTGNL